MWQTLTTIQFTKQRQCGIACAQGPLKGPISTDQRLQGDNLSTHFTKVLKLAQENGTWFICLPVNATHLCQPLDVAFFGPLKKQWHSVLEKYKTNYPKCVVLAREAFPGPLKGLVQHCNLSGEENVKSGFWACGVFPFNPQEVLKKLPDYMSQDE